MMVKEDRSPAVLLLVDVLLPTRMVGGGPMILYLPWIHGERRRNGKEVMILLLLLECQQQQQQQQQQQ